VDGFSTTDGSRRGSAFALLRNCSTLRPFPELPRPLLPEPKQIHLPLQTARQGYQQDFHGPEYKHDAGEKLIYGARRSGTDVVVFTPPVSRPPSRILGATTGEYDGTAS
jgi:hypothetical protein